MRDNRGGVQFKGGGEVKISQGGRRASGVIDLHAKPGGYARANIYSPLGPLVASIEANDSAGVFKSGPERIDFRYDSPMRELALPAARNFTYGEIIAILSGGAPRILDDLPDKPDTVVYRRGEAIAVWLSDELAVRIGVSRRNGRLRSASFEYLFSASGEFAAVKFSRFQNGAAREISITDDDGNYIIVKYDTVKITSANSE